MVPGKLWRWRGTQPERPRAGAPGVCAPYTCRPVRGIALAGGNPEAGLPTEEDVEGG